MTETVALLHGLWMPGSEMIYVKHRLESQERFAAHIFSYPSVRGTLDDSAAAFAEFARRLDVERLHIVGHSLGGIVALRAVSKGLCSSGRIVCLGSPLNGSRAARALAEQSWGSVVAGRAVIEATITDPVSGWADALVHSHEVGVIAGSQSAGMGRVLARFEEPNDGTVAVSETRLAGAQDHIVLPVSHSGMVFSSEVADQAAAFLRRGEFLRED